MNIYTIKKRTAKQEQRQEKQYRANGRYAKMNPCEFCGVSCGATYYSSYDCNETGVGVCLCKSCAEKSWKEYEAKHPEKFNGEQEISDIERHRSNIFNIICKIGKKGVDCSKCKGIKQKICFETLIIKSKLETLKSKIKIEEKKCEIIGCNRKANRMVGCCMMCLFHIKNPFYVEKAKFLEKVKRVREMK